MRVNNLLSWLKANPDYQDGERNHEWKGGTCRSTIRRTCKRILEKAGIDMFVCQSCGKRSTIRHQVHHKDQNRVNNNVNNLEVLCVRCHNSGWIGARHVRPRNAKTGRFS